MSAGKRSWDLRHRELLHRNSALAKTIIDINTLMLMMTIMRTTVTIDDDLAAQVEAMRKREGLSFKAALNHLLRLGVQAKSTPPKPKMFTTPTRKLGLKPGIDPTRLNALIDDLETGAFADEER